MIEFLIKSENLQNKLNNSLKVRDSFLTES
jgi:hypothetical protein